MDPVIIKVRERPEHKIQVAIMAFLKLRGWFVKATVGNAYQSGFPDIYATHKIYRQRWIEVKLPGMVGSCYTPAQLATFPEFCANGSGVWVLTAATETEYDKLMKPCNWHHYLH